jgi:hypothetical protein
MVEAYKELVTSWNQETKERKERARISIPFNNMPPVT